MEVFLIRHTTPDVEKSVCYGQSDLEINRNLFEQEFKIIKEKIPLDIEKAYTSPLFRCKFLAEKLNQIVEIDERLIELNFGLWENKKWSDINREEFDLWSTDFVNAAPPNGESFMQMYYRVTTFLEDLIASDADKVAIITHAGVIRSILSYILDLPLNKTFRIQIRYGEVIKIILNKDRELGQVCLNL